MRNREKYNEYQRVYQLKRYHERMATARTKLGNKCSICEAKDNLEIDHIEWREKKINISKLWSIAQHRFEEELNKCQLLCDSCHNFKSRSDISEIKREFGGANQYGPY